MHLLKAKQNKKSRNKTTRNQHATGAYTSSYHPANNNRKYSTKSANRRDPAKNSKSSSKLTQYQKIHTLSVSVSSLLSPIYRADTFYTVPLLVLKSPQNPNRLVFQKADSEVKAYRNR